MWWSLVFLNKWFSINHKKTNLNVIQNKYDDEKIYLNDSQTKIRSLVSF